MKNKSNLRFLTNTKDLMNRKEFIKLCSILGLAAPLPGMLSACRKNDSNPFKGKVIIIGAGAGGLSAGYLLQQQGVNFELLEASAMVGGRMRINTNFADFPIPLGAEWLETDPSIFGEIVNNPSVDVDIQTVEDDPDRKFVNYSWFNFFQQYILPSVADKINYNTRVESISYADTQVQVNTTNGIFTADKVIVCVPLKMLQLNSIVFNPALPTYKQNAINNTLVWDGFKAFIEFSSKFYPDAEYVFPVTPETEGQKLYYNAALGQNTGKNILGLFVVGTPAQDYISRSGDDLKNFILNELDGLYANQASANYLNHITQNWNDEPFIQGGYLSDYANWQTVRDLGKPVDDKIYFAGGEFTDGEDWVSVHTAAQSAKKAVDELNA